MLSDNLGSMDEAPVFLQLNPAKERGHSESGSGPQRQAQPFAFGKGHSFSNVIWASFISCKHKPVANEEGVRPTID